MKIRHRSGIVCEERLIFWVTPLAIWYSRKMDHGIRSQSLKDQRGPFEAESELLRPCEKGACPDVRDRLNALLRGWCTYFCYGTTMIAYRAVERNVYNRTRRFLVERYKVQSRGIRRFPSERVFGELGVMLPRPIKPAVLRVP